MGSNKSPYMTLTWCRRGELNPHGLSPYGPQPYASASSATPTYLYMVIWCRRGESNPHGHKAHCALNAARLPVPPLRHSPLGCTIYYTHDPSPCQAIYNCRRNLGWWVFPGILPLLARGFPSTSLRSMVISMGGVLVI